MKQTKKAEKENPSPKPETSKDPLSSPKPKISRNVGLYHHFLKHEYITEKDIEWVLKLR